MYWSTRAMCRTAIGMIARSSGTAVGPARLLSREFVRGYVITMRPYLLFVSGIAGIVGLALAPGIPAVDTLLLAAAFFLSYGFGQALTDCFQVDTDSLSAPYRPLVRGDIRRRDVMIVSLVGLAAIGLTLALYNALNIPLAAVAVLGLATYTTFKRRWWAGPFYNAWIVALLTAIAYFAALGAAGAGAEPSPALLATILCVFFGYANFVLAGYYKDISADRATGYRTLPVVAGMKVSTIVSDIFAAAGLTACVVALLASITGRGLGAGHAVAALLFLGGVGTAVTAQLRLHRVRDEGEAHRAIAPVVHTFILQLAAIAGVQKPSWAPALLLYYVAYRAVMRRRPMKEQI
ncbi:MAG: UbiA family prenyltransferase [Gemmatimonadota bacterium]|nr:MAG: UbiA family prenyltransferase [Gemmatimonadota bacterium]